MVGNAGTVPDSETTPDSILDVARFILDELGEAVSTMKLQKLCYFAQGWTLAWTQGIPLFKEDFEAWRNGPVCRDLWEIHRGMFSINGGMIGTRPALQSWQGDVTKAAIAPYSSMTGWQLSTLTHRVGPWVTAREGIGSSASSNVVIPKSMMQAYFKELSEAQF